MGVLDVFNWEGVCVAPGSTIFTVSPSWTRLDNLGGGLRVAEVQIRRGRSDEFDRTDTGTCTVGLKDRDGTVDPSSVNWISRPLAFAVRNPVTDTWHPRFRGGIEDHGYNLSPARIKGDVVLSAADAQSYFANFELHAGLAGDPPPKRHEGQVYFEDTIDLGPQIRINQALDNAQWPVGNLRSIFTGNVNMLASVYSPGESILNVMQDAAEAEFPGVANFLVDRYGVVCFRGRLARFDPVTTADEATHWDFHEWTVGDGATQIGPPFASRRSAAMIRNSAMCYPANLPTKRRPDQVVTHAGSIAIHGYRSWSATDLYVKNGTESTLDGPEECLTYAEYIIANYHDPEPRLSQVTLRPVRPDDPRGPEIWDLLCNVDISDRITVTMEHPGGGGFDQQFFVEGISEVWRPLHFDLDTGYPFCQMTLDLSPATYWTVPP